MIAGFMKNNDEFISNFGLQRLLDYLEVNLKESVEMESNERFLDVSSIVINKIVDIIPPENDRRVLVILYNSLEEINFFIDKGYKVTSITSNQKAYEVGKYIFENIHLMDQSFINFPDKSFDIIWSKHTLQKSIFPSFTLKEFYRVLKDDGLLYVEVPADTNIITDKKIEQSDKSLYTKALWQKNLENANFNVIDNVDVNLHRENTLHNDLFWMYFCNKIKAHNLQSVQKKIYLALSKGENFGWGVCSKYLRKEVSKLYSKTYEWDFEQETGDEEIIDGKVFHAITGIEFESISKIRGTENYGYTFFENELLPKSIQNAKNYDLVIGGSTWCKDKMLEKGINNVDVLIQGIDPEIFYPVENKQNEDMFVIFSGGKFELRKGQDSVLKAVSILQKKYPNIVLVNVWYNMWPHTMDLMYNSPHIKFEHFGTTWIEQMEHLYQLNDIDAARVATYEIVPNTQLRELYALTDIGIFPNRCEGGTNLVLMEYMACARPVIASYTSGHTDVLTDEISYPLKQMKPFRLYDNDNKLWADWEDVSIVELVDKIEYAYNNRAEIRLKGAKAGEYMKNFTWQKSAEDLLKIMGI